MPHWLLHALGLDNASGPVYLGLSGFVGDLSLAGAALAIYRKHQCHTARCWRFGHYDFTDGASGITWRVCRRCHPGHPGHRLTRSHIARIHASNRAHQAQATQGES